MQWSRGTPKMVKPRRMSVNWQLDLIPNAHTPNVEPFVGLFMKNIVFITKFTWSDTFFQGLSFCSGSIFIRATDV